MTFPQWLHHLPLPPAAHEALLSSSPLCPLRLMARGVAVTPGPQLLPRWLEPHWPGCWSRGHMQNLCSHPGPKLSFMICCHCLKILIIVEQGAVRFHFALGPTNSIAGPGWPGCCFWVQTPYIWPDTQSRPDGEDPHILLRGGLGTPTLLALVPAHV